jgi:4-aminobutyrate aminotransferase-like enzyme
VQTGFGRLGDYFWGFEKHEIVPDLVAIPYRVKLQMLF